MSNDEILCNVTGERIHVSVPISLSEQVWKFIGSCQTEENQTLSITTLDPEMAAKAVHDALIGYELKHS